MLAAAGAAAVGAAAGNLFARSVRTKGSAPKNVVFIISDALRADRLGCYGGHSGRLTRFDDLTPELDRLARQGVLFERCIAPSSWTLQSMGAIMSSRLPFIEGDEYNEGYAPREIPTLAEAFSNAGYETIAFMSNPWLCLRDAARKKDPVAARGFASWNVISTDMVPNPMYVNKTGERMVYDHFVRAGDMMKRAIAALQARRHDPRPFFMYVHLMDTHEPYNPPPRYKAQCLVPPRNNVPDFMLYQCLRWAGIVSGREEIPPKDMDLFRRARSLYNASVRYVDDSVGAFIEYLAETGLDDNTLLVFSADHGEEFQEHGWVGHSRTLYEESLHVPLIFYGADAAADARMSDQVSGLDIAPTILAACGIGAPGGMAGRALPLSGSDNREPLPAISALVKPCQPGGFNENIFATSDPRGIKLIRYEFLGSKAGTPPRDELFDRRADPAEQTDISQARTSTVAALGKELQLLRDTHKAGITESITIDEATRRQLKALGYLGG